MGHGLLIASSNGKIIYLFQNELYLLLKSIYKYLTIAIRITKDMPQSNEFHNKCP